MDITADLKTSTVMDRAVSALRAKRIPLWVKLAYSLFIAVYLPANWKAYGPVNLLWLCDVTVLLTLVALWAESSLLASMLVVASLIPFSLWTADFLCNILTGHFIIGLSSYMYDEHIPVMVRALSLFHAWLIPMLLWMIYRLGYDRRAWLAQTAVGAVLLLVSWMVSDPPPRINPWSPTNINWVYGPGEYHAQRRLPPVVYLGLLMFVYANVIHLPTHLALSLVMRKRKVGS